MNNVQLVGSKSGQSDDFKPYLKDNSKYYCDKEYISRKIIKILNLQLVEIGDDYDMPTRNDGVIISVIFKDSITKTHFRFSKKLIDNCTKDNINNLIGFICDNLIREYLKGNQNG